MAMPPQASTSSKDCCFANAIKTMCCCAESFIYGICGIPIGRVIAAFSLANAVTNRKLLIRGTHASNLNAAQLLYASSLGRFLPETKTVHGPHNLDPQLVRQRQLRLIQQPIRSRPAGLTHRVQTDTPLSDPKKQGAAFSASPTYTGAVGIQAFLPKKTPQTGLFRLSASFSSRTAFPVNNTTKEASCKYCR